MAEQIFKSPGFFEREIEVIKRPSVINRDTPAAVVGMAEKGPAFVPTHVSSTEEFIKVFGVPNRKMPATQAAYEFLEAGGKAVQFCRVLGSGLKDEVNAGFIVNPVLDGSTIEGCVSVLSSEMNQTGIDNVDNVHSFGATFTGVRAKIITADGFSLTSATLTSTTFAASTLTGVSTAALTDDKFQIKIVDGANDKGPFTVSLDPTDEEYISRVLNTDPLKLEEEGHVLYSHFPIETSVVNNTSVKIVNGGTEQNCKDLGTYTNRFFAPKTPHFISQPFSGKEYDLFRFESLDDGSYASDKYKISITNLRASDDVNNKFGSFTVVVRDLRDTDENQIVYETFANCNLNPESDMFVAKVIGDIKTYLYFDAASEDERRLITEGSYRNVSNHIRVIVHEDVLSGECPQESLPIGFRGIDSMVLSAADINDSDSNIMLPLPLRVKVTKGDRASQALSAQNGDENFRADLYWGMLTTTIKIVTNPNYSSDFNEIIPNLLAYSGSSSKFNLTSQSSKDANNHNKFTLDNVTLGTLTTIASVKEKTVTDLGGVTYYDRDGSDTSALSLADLLAQDAQAFNRYSILAKFTAPMQGGWNGLNPFDKDMAYMTDRSVSTDASDGKAISFSSALFATSDSAGAMHGEGDNSNAVASFKNAIRLVTDEMVTNSNVIAVPGIREPLVTDYVTFRVENYGRSIYLMDIPLFDKSGARIFVDCDGLSSGKTDILEVASQFDSRQIDSSYAAAYFPDVLMLDHGDVEGSQFNRRVIRMPASVAALSGIGNTDAIASPWFAPAGFGRGSLERVKGLDIRLNTKNRDDLYEARINPIANFPNNQFVIFGQKTTQIARTALDRVNVRRLVLEVKRQIEVIAHGLLFAQNNNITRSRFVKKASSSLANIQSRSGIEDFRVVMDDTNNTSEDVDNNRLNGKIVIVPTRAVEFIQIDFVVTNSGVEYP